MGKFVDLTGQRFEKLVVIRRAENTSYGHPQWLCQCDCGNQTIVLGAHLRSGHTKSCGCMHKIQAKKMSQMNFRHGMSHTRIHNIWMTMIQRTTNENCRCADRYIKRGITICDDWKNSFESFYEWSMANGYKDDLTIDRIDNDKGYYPENCRWVDSITQANNTSTNKFLEYNDEKKTMAEWSRILGIKYSVLSSKIKRGLTIQEVIEKQ